MESWKVVVKEMGDRAVLVIVMVHPVEFMARR